MEPENSNDIRPTEQIPPQPVNTKPAECPEEYFTIRIPKTKLKKCIKLALIIVFVLSLWMNLMFLCAAVHVRHGMRDLMGGVQIQYHMNGNAGSYRMPSGGGYMAPGNNSGAYSMPGDNGGKYFTPGRNGGNGDSFFGNSGKYNSGSTYYGNGKAQYGNSSGSYRMPSN